MVTQNNLSIAEQNGLENSQNRFLSYLHLI